MIFEEYMLNAKYSVASESEFTADSFDISLESSTAEFSDINPEKELTDLILNILKEEFSEDDISEKVLEGFKEKIEALKETISEKGFTEFPELMLDIQKNGILKSYSIKAIPAPAKKEVKWYAQPQTYSVSYSATSISPKNNQMNSDCYFFWTDSKEVKESYSFGGSTAEMEEKMKDGPIMANITEAQLLVRIRMATDFERPLNWAQFIALNGALYRVADYLTVGNLHGGGAFKGPA